MSAGDRTFHRGRARDAAAEAAEALQTLCDRVLGRRAGSARYWARNEAWKNRKRWRRARRDLERARKKMLRHDQRSMEIALNAELARVEFADFGNGIPVVFPVPRIDWSNDPMAGDRHHARLAVDRELFGVSFEEVIYRADPAGGPPIEVGRERINPMMVKSDNGRWFIEVAGERVYFDGAPGKFFEVKGEPMGACVSCGRSTTFYRGPGEFGCPACFRFTFAGPGAR